MDEEWERISSTTLINRKTKKIRVESIVTADEEEPNCGRCKYFGRGDKFAVDYICGCCGPENFWAHYERVNHTDMELDDMKMLIGGN